MKCGSASASPNASFGIHSGSDIRLNTGLQTETRMLPLICGGRDE